MKFWVMCRNVSGRDNAAGVGWGTVSIFESGVGAGRRSVGAGAFSNTADAGTQRLRRRAAGLRYARADGAPSGGWQAVQGLARLVFPVLLLATAGAAAFLYGDEPARWLGNADVGGNPFASGVLALPATFFIVHLTNRRYGAGYAFAQVLLTAALVVGAMLYMGDDLTLLHPGALPESRLVAAFGGGLFAAQLVSIFMFDRLRGPRWWQAPFFASLFGGIVLGLVAFPAAYAGTDALWTQPMVTYIGVSAAAALVLIVPYWMLRSLVEPLSGFGGY